MYLSEKTKNINISQKELFIESVYVNINEFNNILIFEAR